MGERVKEREGRVKEREGRGGEGRGRNRFSLPWSMVEYGRWLVLSFDTYQVSNGC